MELNRDTINKIEEMANINNKVVAIFDENGKERKFCEEKLSEIKPERNRLKAMTCKSLEGFVNYIKHIQTIAHFP